MFPKEDEKKCEIALECESHFSFCRRLLDYWLHSPKDRWLSRARLPRLVIDHAMMMNVQANRLFRSIFELCERGEGFSGAILARTLFETVLAQQFVLKRRVCIVLQPELDKGTGKPKVTAGGVTKYHARLLQKGMSTRKADWLSRRFRALLYYAHVAFEGQRRANAISSRRGMKRSGRRLQKAMDPAVIANCEASIGPEWTFVLRHGPGYSGLSVAILCKCLHSALFGWYDTVYDLQSEMTHAANAFHHLEFVGTDIGPKYISTPQETASTLQAASAMYLVNYRMILNAIHFGSNAETAYASFAKEFHEVFNTPDSELTPLDPKPRS